MPISIQSNAVLSKVFDSFRDGYVKMYPGSNMNDIEREFLSCVFNSVRHSFLGYTISFAEVKETQALIEAVR